LGRRLSCDQRVGVRVLVLLSVMQSPKRIPGEEGGGGGKKDEIEDKDKEEEAWGKKKE